MSFRNTFLFLVLSLFGSLHVYAAPLCRNALLEPRIPHESMHLLEKFWARGLNGEPATYLKRKPGKEWEDHSTRPDIAGDIRAGLKLPAHLAQLFSFAAFDHQLMPVDGLNNEDMAFVRVPSFKEICAGIEALHSQAEKETQDFVSFKFIKVDKVISDIDYLRHLAVGEMPMGTMGHLYEHDLNFHFLSGLVMPKEVLESIMSSAKAAVDFYDFAREKSLTDSRFERMPALINNHFIKPYVKHVDWTGDLYKSYFAADKSESSKMRMILKSATTPFEMLSTVIPLLAFEEGKSANNSDSAKLGELLETFKATSKSYAQIQPFNLQRFDWLGFSNLVTTRLERLDMLAEQILKNRKSP